MYVYERKYTLQPGPVMLTIEVPLYFIYIIYIHEYIRIHMYLYIYIHIYVSINTYILISVLYKHT
jgi:hypothetical protein